MYFSKNLLKTKLSGQAKHYILKPRVLSASTLPDILGRRVSEGVTLILSSGGALTSSQLISGGGMDKRVTSEGIQNGTYLKATEYPQSLQKVSER